MSSLDWKMFILFDPPISWIYILTTKVCVCACTCMHVCVFSLFYHCRVLPRREGENHTRKTYCEAHLFQRRPAWRSALTLLMFSLQAVSAECKAVCASYQLLQLRDQVRLSRPQGYVEDLKTNLHEVSILS